MIRTSCSPPEVNVMDETGTPVSSGPLPLQRGVSAPTILPRFEDYHVHYERKVQETKAMKLGAIKWGRNKRKCVESLGAFFTAINCQVPGAAGSSSIPV